MRAMNEAEPHLLAQIAADFDELGCAMDRIIEAMREGENSETKIERLRNIKRNADRVAAIARSKLQPN